MNEHVLREQKLARVPRVHYKQEQVNKHEATDHMSSLQNMVKNVIPAPHMMAVIYCDSSACCDSSVYYDRLWH